MRTIKFRAWIEEREGFFGIEKSYMATQGEPDIESFQSFMHHYGNETNLMQFTGLKDINGKEIYEGDVVNFGMDGVIYSDNGNYILFEDGAFCIYLGNDRFNPCLCDAKGVEVLGNIYEHPSLISQ